LVVVLCDLVCQRYGVMILDIGKASILCFWDSVGGGGMIVDIEFGDYFEVESCSLQW